jgi:hypothetical protein
MGILLNVFASHSYRYSDCNEIAQQGHRNPQRSAWQHISQYFGSRSIHVID